jgi:hypothetical protein
MANMGAIRNSNTLLEEKYHGKCPFCRRWGDGRVRLV